ILTAEPKRHPPSTTNIFLIIIFMSLLIQIYPSSHKQKILKNNITMCAPLLLIGVPGLFRFSALAIGLSFSIWCSVAHINVAHKRIYFI
ncbi:MAG: hypothetical protein CMG19_00005, partial [Candidatus Marinimicrobia bacterium]|nr:hypothetical protein [Candidatus Neomarinimicrobiota bacterium]